MVGVLSDRDPTDKKDMLESGTSQSGLGMISLLFSGRGLLSVCCFCGASRLRKQTSTESEPAFTEAM